MSLPRVSIKSLMGVVVLVAVGLAALNRPNNGWATLLSTVALATLPMSLLGLIFRRGPARAGWVGFAVFGWSFFLLISRTIGLGAPQFGTGAGVTNPLIGFDYRFSLFRIEEALYLVASVDGKKLDELLVIFGKEDWESRSRVAFSWMGLAFALLGARIARAFAASPAD